MNGWYYITETTIQPETIEEIIMSIKSVVTISDQATVRSESLPERNLEQNIRLDKIPVHHTLESEVDTERMAIGEKKRLIETEEIEDESDDRSVMNHFSPRVSYSFHEEEFIASLQYDAPILDYEKLWYGENKQAGPGYVSEYVTSVPADTNSEMLTTQEAADTFMNIQYSAIMGNVYEVSGEERRKFNLWIAFNPALFKLFESLQGLTRDVNYAMI